MSDDAPMLHDDEPMGSLDQQKLLPRLGLTETKPIPEPFRFPEADPLGFQAFNTNTSDNAASTPSLGGKFTI